MDKNVYKELMEQAAPSAALIQKTKNKMLREETIMIKRSFSAAAIVAAAVMLLVTTAFGAWYFLKPSELAREFNDNALSAAFESDAAININKSVASGDYVFTLLAVVSGKDISDMPYYSESVNDERTYAVVAIQNADGTPMPAASRNGFGVEPFTATFLIKGLEPWIYNMGIMNGGYSATVADGVLYRIVECDGVAMFADRGLYFAVCSGPSVNENVFALDALTGEISVNPEYEGAGAVFSLPLDPSLADPAKAEQYLADMRAVYDEASAAAAGGAGENVVVTIYGDGAIDWNDAVPVTSTVKELVPDADGILNYSWDTDEYGSGDVSAASGYFTDAPGPQAAIVYVMQEEGPDGVRNLAVRFAKDENGVITGMIVVPKE